MPAKVVDTSAIAALVFGEPEAGQVVLRLHGGTLAAPTLLPFEIASVCLKKLTRHPDQRESLQIGLRLFTRLEIATHDVELTEAVELAWYTGLSAYDTSYLWLARRLSAELVTLDGRLARAWAGA